MAPNTAKWGREKARERYGSSRGTGGVNNLGPAEDNSKPQKLGDMNNLQGPDYENDHRNDWVRGGPNESAESKPGFDGAGISYNKRGG